MKVEQTSLVLRIENETHTNESFNLTLSQNSDFL